MMQRLTQAPEVKTYTPAPVPPWQMSQPPKPTPPTPGPNDPRPPDKGDPIQRPYQEGGIVEGAGNDELTQQVLQLVIGAMMKPNDPESAGIIEGFAEAFGEEALAEVEALLQSSQGAAEMPAEAMMPMQAGGLIPGNGDAMADDIITTADAGTPGAQDIAISSGEYIVAGDVVSGLGSGNSQAGAEVLDQLQQDVRMERTGSPEQPPPIDLSEVLPATYGEEYA